MADVNISDLDNVGDLPNGEPDIQYTDLFLAQHNNEAVNVTGEQLTKFVSRNVESYQGNIVASDAAGGAEYADNVLTLNLPHGAGISSITKTGTQTIDGRSVDTYSVVCEATQLTGSRIDAHEVGTFTVTNGRDGTGQVNKVCGILPDGSRNITIGNLANKLYPLGAVYISMQSTSPATLFGGTWQQIQGRFLVAQGHVDGDTSKPEFTAATGGSVINSDGTLVQDVVNFSNGQADIGFTSDDLTHLYLNRKGVGTATFGVDNDPVVGNMLAAERTGASDTHLQWYGPTAERNVDAVSLRGTQDINLPPYLPVFMWIRTGLYVGT